MILFNTHRDLAFWTKEQSFFQISFKPKLRIEVVFRFFVKDVNMPEELLLLAIVGALTLYISLSLLVIRLIWMVSTGLGTTAELMMVSWLIGIILIFAIPLKDVETSDTSNVKVRGCALLRSPT